MEDTAIFMKMLNVDWDKKFWIHFFLIYTVIMFAIFL